VALRHHFHAHPELSWKEVQTTQKIVETLKSYGFKEEDLRVGFGGTSSGVIADINKDVDGPCIALRGDIDALPIVEENDVSYKSQNEGVMHACGHDAHNALLLGAAKVLMSMKDELPGHVRLLFQPAEEHGIKAGANIMIKEGALEGVDAIYGQHVWASVPSGKIQYKIGPFMASADGFELKIQGKGGHGSAPQYSVDPTIAAANFVFNLQTIISREIDPQDTVVMSIGKLQAGSAFNIIPDKVGINGTIRTFNPEVRNSLPDRMQRIVDGLCTMTRCTADFEYQKMIPTTINDEEVELIAKDVAEDIFGADNVEESPLIMGGEDFAFYQEKIPGGFCFVGIGNPDKGTDNPHHSPHFNVDDEVLWKGVATYAGVAWKYLVSHK
jgi:amidohydrolase